MPNSFGSDDWQPIRICCLQKWLISIVYLSLQLQKLVTLPLLWQKMNMDNKGSAEKCIGHRLCMTEDENKDKLSSSLNNEQLPSPENFVDLLIDEKSEEEMHASFTSIDLLMDNDSNNEAAAVPILTLTKLSDSNMAMGSDDIKECHNKESKRQSKQSKVLYEL